MYYAFFSIQTKCHVDRTIIERLFYVLLFIFFLTFSNFFFTFSSLPFRQKSPLGALRFLNLHEYQAKDLMEAHGVIVQEGRMADTPDRAFEKTLFNTYKNIQMHIQNLFKTYN